MAALPVSRRRVLGQGLGATLALAAGPVLVGPAAARAQAAEDGPIIAARVGLEQNSSYAYGLARAQAGLPAPVRALLDQIHAHETQHVGAMLTLLAQVGGAAPLRPTAPSQLDPITRRLALARGRAAVLTAAVALEQASVASYYAAARDLHDARTLESVGSVMAAEGQHLVALRTLLGLDPIPDALAVGSPLSPPPRR